MTAEVATPATGSSTSGNSDVAASGMHSAIHQRATQNVAPSVANAGALSPNGDYTCVGEDDARDSHQRTEPQRDATGRQRRHADFYHARRDACGERFP
jgi:hypothetical protein